MKPEPTFRIPQSIQEGGVNVRPRSAIKDTDPLDLPFEDRPGVWVYYLMPFYEDPDRDYYYRLSCEELTNGKIVFKAECEHCFWRLGHSPGTCLAFPGGIPEDLESHLSLVPGDRGICYMGKFEASIMDVPVGLPLEQAQKLMKKVLNKRKKLTYPPRPKEFPWE